MGSRRHNLLKKKVVETLKRLGCENIEVGKKILIGHYDHKHILRVDVCGILNGLRIVVECGKFNPIDCPYERYLDPAVKLSYN